MSHQEEKTGDGLTENPWIRRVHMVVTAFERPSIQGLIIGQDPNGNDIPLDLGAALSASGGLPVTHWGCSGFVTASMLQGIWDLAIEGPAPSLRIYECTTARTPVLEATNSPTAGNKVGQSFPWSKVLADFAPALKPVQVSPT